MRQALPTDAVLVEWFRYLPFDPKAKELQIYVDGELSAKKPRLVSSIFRSVSFAIAYPLTEWTAKDVA